MGQPKDHPVPLLEPSRQPRHIAAHGTSPEEYIHASTAAIARAVGEAGAAATGDRRRYAGNRRFW